MVFPYAFKSMASADANVRYPKIDVIAEIIFAFSDIGVISPNPTPVKLITE